MTFDSGLPAGNYEVRVYIDWSKGSYKVSKKYSFSVSKKYFEDKKTNYVLKTEKKTYAENEKIKVIFDNLPGSKHDWIAIANVNSSNESHIHYKYIKKKKKGHILFPGLPPGKYEVRVYLDWAKGSYRVSKRYIFHVK